MNRIWRRIVGTVPVLLAVCTLTKPLAASAGEVTFNFADVLSGTAPGSANLPWTQAVFQDLAPGVVSLTLANLSLTASENLDRLYFNLNPSLDPGELSFTCLGGSGSFVLPSIDLGANAFSAPGGRGTFDIRLLFGQRGTEAARFGAGESITYQITGLPNLTAADFAFPSQFRNLTTSLYAIAHIQRIGLDAADSGWIASASSPAVPEPQPAWLYFAGLAVFAVGRRVGGLRTPQG